MNLLDDTFPTSYRAPQTRSYAKVTPPEVDTPNYPKRGPQNCWLFIFQGLGFWIFFMIKRPLEPHCKIIFLRMRVATHLFSEISCHHSSESFTLYFYSLCTFSLINRKLCITVSLCLWLHL
jgi:hypothetical protein